MREKRGFGPWGWLLLIFGLLVFFSNGGFFADGTNIISPAVAERLNVDQSIILTMNSVAGIVGVLIAVAAGQVNQRIGPSKVAAGCLILAGLGHIAACNAVNVPMYLIAMCFVGGGLSSGSFVGVGNGLQLWNHALCPAAQRPGGLDRHADGLCDLRRRGRRGGCDRHGASARYPQGAGPLSR